MNEYRCTIPGNYPKPAPGLTDPAQRQGYYINAETPEAAAQDLFERYPSIKAVDVQAVKGAAKCQPTRIGRTP